MAYNYPPPASFGRAPSYANFPGAPSMGAPPGMAGAPGLAAPTAGSPPGMAASTTPQPGRPGSVPAAFQPPPHLPNINFNAPVIRLGVDGSPKPATPYGGYDDSRGRGRDQPSGPRGRAGLGADSRNMDYQRQQVRNDMMSLVPPTKEEVSRTIFIAGLVDGMPQDEQMEDLIGVGGGLRRWTRATDADGKDCRFGFAEYEDALSLEVASEILKDVEVPLREKGQLIKDEEGNAKKASLMVVMDDESRKYAAQWNKDRDQFQFRLDAAREDLSSLLARLASEEANTNGTAAVDGDGDATMEGANGDSAELITIPVGQAEDELADIPAELRETVAAEIAAFRDRSNRRDLERLRKEEELEAAERARSNMRPSRLASPPVSAPSGPGAVNGTRGVPNAPSGPKGYRGVQLPRDAEMERVLAQINGTDLDGDDDASDSELERRRRAAKDADKEKAYLDQERRWFNRERMHATAVQRQREDESRRSAATQRRKDAALQRLKEYDDEVEMRSAKDGYYKDRKAWVRERRAFRADEKRRDDRDRRDEAKEQAAQRAQLDKAQGLADEFLAEQAAEIEARHAPRPAATNFTLNLGFGAAAKTDEDDDAETRKTGGRQTMVDVENILDNEEAADETSRPLRPVSFQPLAAGEKMTDAERREATRAIAASIPTTTRELFEWPVKWDSLPEAAVTEQLRPFIQKKIMESLGVQEDMLVELVEGVVRRHGRPEEIMRELEVTLDEEAEALTKKVWRMVVFFSEIEARGLGG